VLSGVWPQAPPLKASYLALVQYRPVICSSVLSVWSGLGDNVVISGLIAQDLAGRLFRITEWLNDLLASFSLLSWLVATGP